MSVLSLKKIASRYASALAEISLDEATISELKLLEELFKDPNCATFLNNPELSFEAKKAVLDKVVESGLSEAVAKLVFLMLSKKRIAAVPYLCESYKAIYYQMKSIVVADVAAPTPLDSEELAVLKKELERVTSKTVQFGEIICDKSLLAGLRVTIEDRRIDFSIKSSLELLKKQLLA